MATAGNSSGAAEAESNLKLQRLMQRIDQIAGNYDLALYRDIVAFVGPTKSGKSTLINCLMNSKLKCVRDSYTLDGYIVKELSEPGPKIGASGESETEHPECFGKLAGTQYEMWDFAGFGDNKGTEQEILNALSYQAILRPQKSVRFVLVVPYEMLRSDDPLPFYKQLHQLKTLCPEMVNALCIVSTKDEKSRTKLLLAKMKSYYFPNANEDNFQVIEEGKRIIDQVLKNGTCVDFKAPCLDEGTDEGVFILPNMTEITDCIKKLKGTQVQDFPLMISDHAKHIISDLYSVFYHMVKREVESTIHTFENHIQTKINEVLQISEEGGRAASQLAHFKVTKSKLIELIEESDGFPSFFQALSKLGLGMDTRFSETIKKFIFVENLRNMYKTSERNQNSKGEEEFFANVMAALAKAANKFSDLIIISAAATEEEKKREEEMKSKYETKMADLIERIGKLEKENESLLTKESFLPNQSYPHPYEHGQTEKTNFRISIPTPLSPYPVQLQCECCIS